ncbi:formate dehydrogenase accessory sulfurtransferase FdhD [Terrimonas alba]|uniref:formate dehydrogenase accessory sulfurtransferase FdhD n=1 Tax=Terrimonas alba TaxID=3349636 RepID=UPI0035F4ADD7
MEQPFITKTRIVKINLGQGTVVDDQLAVEEPLQIELIYGPAAMRQRKNITVTMRTPGHDLELAIGFLFTEGIITNKEEVLRVQQDNADGNTIAVTLKEDIDPGLKKLERNFFTNSSCGVCGKSGIDNIRTVSAYSKRTGDISLRADLFYTIYDKLRLEQTMFDCTGGLHASALFDQQGNFLLVREDVGRHNALDKAIGACLLNDQLPLDNNILLLSGRASFELIQKANMAGIRIVTAVGAPSSLAVDLARECGITLIGFLRDERFNIYAGKDRIIFNK